MPSAAAAAEGAPRGPTLQGGGGQPASPAACPPSHPKAALRLSSRSTAALRWSSVTSMRRDSEGGSGSAARADKEEEDEEEEGRSALERSARAGRSVRLAEGGGGGQPQQG